MLMMSYKTKPLETPFFIRCQNNFYNEKYGHVLLLHITSENWTFTNNILVIKNKNK